jgi:WD40 repeat protein
MQLRISLTCQFEQQRSETCDLAFSQDGKQLVSSDGNALYLWQLNGDGKWDYKRSYPYGQIAVLRFAPDLAFYLEEVSIKLISFDGKEVATFPCPPSPFWTISPNLRWLVSNGRERTILLRDLVSHQSFSIPFPAFDRSGAGADHSDEVVGRFLFTPDYQQLVLFTDSPEGSLHICSFDPEHRRIVLQKTLPEGMIDGIISPNGKMLAIIVPNGQVFGYKEDIYIYDLKSLQLLHVFPQTTNERYNLLSFSPDCQYLISSKTNGWIDIFSLNTFDSVAQFAAHPGLSSHATDPIGGLDWSKTGYIATGGASVFENDMEKTDYTIKIWKVEEQ